MTTPFVTHIWDFDNDHNNEVERAQSKPDLVVERAVDGTFCLRASDGWERTEAVVRLGRIGADRLIQALGGATKVQADVLTAERDAARENADARRQHIRVLASENSKLTRRIELLEGANNSLGQRINELERERPSSWLLSRVQDFERVNAEVSKQNRELQQRNAELNMEINRQADVIAGLRADADEPQREIIALELNGEGEPNVNDVIVELINVLRAGVSSFHISKEGNGWRILADQVRSYRPSLLDALTDARDKLVYDLLRARRRDSASVENLDQLIATLGGTTPTNDQEN